MSKVCMFPLTGDLVMYENEEDLVHTIQHMFPDSNHSRLRLVDAATHTTYTYDTCDTYDMYAFFTPLIVSISRAQLEEASRNMDWSNVVNESLLDLCMASVPPFPNLFTNPHPKVFALLQALDHTKEITQQIIHDACSNESVDVRRWCLQRYPQWVNFRYLLLYDDIPEVDDAVLEWWSQLRTEHEKQLALKRMCSAKSARLVDFAVEKAGGLNHIIRWYAFVNSKSPRVTELKLKYLNSGQQPSHNALRDLLNHDTNDEVISLVIQSMLTTNMYPDMETLMMSHTRIWSKSCMAEHILQLDTHITLNDDQRAELSINTDPRIVSRLLDPISGAKWRRLPMFLCQSSDEATKWSLDWLMSQTRDNNNVWHECYEWLSVNTNVEMVMTLFTRCPTLIENDVHCEWLLSVGKNPDILVELN